LSSKENELGVKFSPAPEVEEIAAQLIPKYHKHLQDYGVRVDYIFSDQEPDKHGKTVLATARKIGGVNAYQSRRDEDEDRIPLTFVCEMCVKWQVEIHRIQIDANDDTYDICPTCSERYKELYADRIPNKLIARLEHGRADARVAFDAGPPAAESYFLITVYTGPWLILSHAKRVALVDHELCHCRCEMGQSGVKLWIRPHDSEEFTDIIDRHGLWRSDVEAIVNAGLKWTPQLTLWTEESEKPSESPQAVARGFRREALAMERLASRSTEPLSSAYAHLASEFRAAAERIETGDDLQEEARREVSGMLKEIAAEEEAKAKSSNDRVEQLVAARAGIVASALASVIDETIESQGAA
jgi:hypothetical protein